MVYFLCVFFVVNYETSCLGFIYINPIPFFFFLDFSLEHIEKNFVFIH